MKKNTHNRSLTPKQQVFVREYCVDLNATKAAIRAGYGRRNARQVASRLLAVPEVESAIAERHGERLHQLEINADRVLQEISLIAFSNMMDYITIGQNGAVRVDLSRLTREQATAIADITVEEFPERTGEDGKGKPIFENVKRIKFKLANKLAALEDLAKHLKLFTEKFEHTGKDGGPLKVEHSVARMSDEQITREIEQILGAAHAEPRCNK